MAWQLLTGPYKLPKEKLYVTYFGGSDQVTIRLYQWFPIGVLHGSAKGPASFLTSMNFRPVFSSRGAPKFWNNPSEKCRKTKKVEKALI